MKLTAKEAEVLKLIVEAKCDCEIARLHWNSKRTIETHVHNILRKCGYKNRRQLMFHYLKSEEDFFSRISEN